MRKVKSYSWNQETIQFHYVMTTQKLHLKDGFGRHGNVEPALDDSLFALGEIGTTPPLHLLAGEMDSEEDDSPNNGIAPRHKKKKMAKSSSLK